MCLGGLAPTHTITCAKTLSERAIHDEVKL